MGDLETASNRCSCTHERRYCKTMKMYTIATTASTIKMYGTTYAITTTEDKSHITDANAELCNRMIRKSMISVS